MWLVEFGRTDPLVFYIFCGLCVLILGFSFSLLILRCVAKHNGPGTSVDFYISFGTVVLAVSVVLRGLSSKWISEESFEILCQFHPSVVTVGLSYVVAALLMKTAAILHYYRDNEYELVKSQEWKPNLWLFIVLVLDLIAILIWLLVFPLKMSAHTPSAQNATEGFDGAPVYLCRGQHDSYWQYGILCFHAVLLILATILVWPTVYKTSGERSSMDSFFLVLSVYNIVLCCGAGVPVNMLVQALVNPSVYYAVEGGIILYACLSTTVFAILAKVLESRKLLYGRPLSGDYAAMNYEEMASVTSSKTSSRIIEDTSTAEDNGHFINPIYEGNSFKY